jgi:hypothetical protein
MTPSTTIMIVDLSVDPARQSGFDRFYHDFYIPEFLRAVPEVLSARRYAEIDILGKLDAATMHFLTVYDLVSDDCMDNIEAAIARSAHQEASDQFKKWKQEGLTYFDRAFFREIHRHPRQPADGCWSDHALYAFVWTVKPDISKSAQRWYVDEYVNVLMSTVPSWLACRTYSRLDSQPSSFLTAFEAVDKSSLVQSVSAANEAPPDAERVAFTKWMENTLGDHTALSLVPIYRSY